MGEKKWEEGGSIARSFPVLTKKERKAQARIEKMAREPIPKLVMSFAASTLVALLLNAVYNLTDTLFVSWGVGDQAMGGMSVVFPFVIFQSAIATAFGGGAASLVSRKLGEGRNAEAGEVTINAMFVFYATAAAMTLGGFLWMAPLLRWMGATEQLYPFARDYFMIILAGNLFSTGFSSIIRAEGKMLYSLLIWVIPITLNIALDAVFILVFGWGVKGAAAATVGCQFVSFSMSILFFTRFSLQHFKGAKIKGRRIREIGEIGFPSLVQMGSFSMMTLLLNNVLRDVGGTLGITTFGYLSKLMTFGLVPFTALSQALAPIVGYNHGAGRSERIRKAVSFSVAVGLAYAVLALIVAETIPRKMLMIFTDDPEIVATGATGIRILACGLLFSPLPLMLGTAMQAEGRKYGALFLYASNLIFLLPIVLLFGRYRGLAGIWVSYLTAGFLSTLLAGLLLFAEKIKTKPVMKEI